MAKNTKKKNNKKGKQGGFTLIELLAVITIMGILMMVAIPSVSRTIENSRRDTFMNTAKSYLNAIKNSVAADELDCGSGATLSSKGTGYYYVPFNSNLTSGKDLMEQGGKSSWGNAEVVGVVVIHKLVSGNRNTYEYGVAMVDSAGRGFGGVAKPATTNGFYRVYTEASIKRGIVQTANGKDSTNPVSSVAQNRSTVYSTSANPTMQLNEASGGKWYFGSTAVGSLPGACSVAM